MGLDGANFCICIAEMGTSAKMSVKQEMVYGSSGCGDVY